jgi:hypothetical protein
MVKISKYLFCFIFCVASYAGVYANSGINVDARFDSLAILIGDQINLTILVEQPREAKVSLPQYKDSITGKIEILSTSRVDTVYLPNNRVRLTQQYLVTSFDSGFYTLGPIKFGYNIAGQQDTIISMPISLTVNTIPIKDPKKIADIKNVIDIPLTFKEMLPYISGGIGLLLLIIILTYFYMRWKNNKPLLGILEKPKEPAHVIAFRELEALKNEKLWQQGQYKQFHSRVSEIVRAYIENRFEVPALESTSEEILVLLKSIPQVDIKTLSEMKEMMAISDLVKFAKAEPMPDENEQIWQIAYNFVLSTFKAPVIEEPMQETKAEEDVAQQVENK